MRKAVCTLFFHTRMNLITPPPTLTLYACAQAVGAQARRTSGRYAINMAAMRRVCDLVLRRDADTMLDRQDVEAVTDIALALWDPFVMMYLTSAAGRAGPLSNDACRMAIRTTAQLCDSPMYAATAATTRHDADDAPEEDRVFASKLIVLMHRFQDMVRAGETLVQARFTVWMGFRNQNFTGASIDVLWDALFPVFVLRDVAQARLQRAGALPDVIPLVRHEVPPPRVPMPQEPTPLPSDLSGVCDGPMMAMAFGAIGAFRGWARAYARKSSDDDNDADERYRVV